MNMEKGIYISEISEGDLVKGIFCVANKALRRTKNGSLFIALTLCDRTGEMEARIWEDARKLDESFDQGDVVRIEAEAVDFNNQIQLRVTNISRCDEISLPPEYFLPSSSINLEDAFDRVMKWIRKVKDAGLRVLMQNIMSDENMRRAFKEAPAAKKMHHAYIGGLLEHCLGLLELVELICRRYTHLKKDLLIAASILHDIGKTKELQWARPPIDYSDEGRLLGHIAIGMEIIDRACNSIGLSRNTGTVLALKHIILSHHGQMEFGSPVLPMTEEAMVFHMIDDLDAKINFLQGLKKRGGSGSDVTGYTWSEYQRRFERYFFLPSLIDEETKEENCRKTQEVKSPIAQPNLWRRDSE